MQYLLVKMSIIKTEFCLKMRRYTTIREPGNGENTAIMHAQ